MRSRTLLSLLLGLAAVVAVTPVAEAQDVVTVGTVQTASANVTVPVYIRDRSGTPLGRDKAAGSRIQSISIKVTFDPALVASGSMDVAGITASLTPTFKIQPSDSASASLLVTFQEATNLVPFTLDASAPGNQVAKLTLTLKQPVPAGTTIPLQLDASLTQLTDEGGTAATKETAANGTLQLVNGSVKTPAATLTFSPSTVEVEPGASANVIAVLGAAATSPVTINLASNDPTIATPSVPSVTIATGAVSASFKVNGLKVGRADITGTAGELSAGVRVNVATAAPACNPPAAPVIAGPSSAYTGASYTISWSAVEGATSYFVDEATNGAFTDATTRSVTTTSASFSHAAIPPDHYFYRVRARRQAAPCDTTSLPSNTLEVALTVAPVEARRVIPVAGSTPGALGSYFRTLVQLHNAGSETVSGRFVFHPAGAGASESDPVLAFSLAPGKSLSYADLLPAMGVASGLGTIDFIASAGSAFPVAAVRVFNDGGAAGTSGFTIEPVRAEEYLNEGDRAMLFAPPDVTRFRLNVGVRTLEQGATLSITVRDLDGQVRTSLQKSYGANFFAQVAASTLLDGLALSAGDTIAFEVTAGSAVIYGATTDNVTNDASLQFARKLD